MNLNKKEQLVSVLIPNYKRDYELKRAIKSALSQTYKTLEILIIDDCSPNLENIKEIVNSFKDSRVSLIIHNENKGGGGARNTGILASKGKYIAFLDSDDTWECTKIEEQVLISEEYDSDILCYTKSNIYTNNWVKIQPNIGIKENESIADYLFVNDGFIPTPSIFVTATLAKRCLFDESLQRHQDYDFLFKLEQENVKVLFLNKELTNVIWIGDQGLIRKGWSSKFSYDFFNSNKKIMTNKAYANALFHSVIYNSAIYESRLKSIKYLFQNIKYMKFIQKKIVLKYLIRLIFSKKLIDFLLKYTKLRVK